MMAAVKNNVIYREKVVFSLSNNFPLNIRIWAFAKNPSPFWSCIFGRKNSPSFEVGNSVIFCCLIFSNFRSRIVVWRDFSY